MTFGGAGIRPISEAEILDLMRALLAADGAEQVPAVFKADNGWVFDRITGIVGPLRRRNERGAGGPVQITMKELLRGASEWFQGCQVERAKKRNKRDYSSVGVAVAHEPTQPKPSEDASLERHWPCVRLPETADQASGVSGLDDLTGGSLFRQRGPRAG